MTKTKEQQQACTQQHQLTVKRISTTKASTVHLDVEFDHTRHRLTFASREALEAFCDADDSLDLSQLVRLAVKQLRRETKGLDRLESVKDRTFTIEVSTN